MLDLYNSCCNTLVILDYKFHRKEIINNNVERVIEFRTAETNTDFRRNLISFSISKKFRFSIGYLLDTKYFYIVKDSSMITDRIELDNVDGFDKMTDLEKVLIHGRIVTDKELTMRLLYNDETDDGFIEIVNFIKRMKI